MKHLLALCCCSCWFAVYAQVEENCPPQLDTAAVIRLAGGYYSYREYGEKYYAHLRFNDTTCTWHVFSQELKYVDFRCRRLNGCRKIISRELIVDDKTGKVKSKTRSKKLYPNYE